MCEICHMSDCSSACPNAQPTEVCKCDNCGESIYLGNYYYKIGERNYCEECVDKSLKEAEEN